MYMYISIFLGALLCVCFFIIWNLFTKLSNYEAWISDILYSLNKIRKGWQDIDSKQMFEKDDEVGTTFEEITELITELNEKVEQTDD